jgi:metal-dependent amidase/aminoacylase/carboxypeptidase family protein
MPNNSDQAVAILAGLPDVRPWQEDLYRDLHQHPELSHQEQRTAGLVAQRLRDFDEEQFRAASERAE